MRALVLVAAVLLVTASSASLRAAEGVTEPAPRLVKDIARGGTGSTPGGFVRAGNLVYFSATTGKHGQELWKTDGTEAGTVLVADIAKGMTSSGPHGMTAIGDSVLFFADDGVHGLGLWRSNGTATGTKLVRASIAGRGLDDGRMVRAGDVVFFLVPNDQNGLALWRTDGTEAGTALVTEATPGLGGIDAGATVALTQAIALGDALVYGVVTTGPGASRTTLWRTLGTPASTVRLHDFELFGAMANVGDAVVFVGDTVLWRTDGTPSGTKVLLPMVHADHLSRTGDRVYFAGDGSLWESDGTPSGTHFVAGHGPDGPVVAVDGTLYFGNDGDLFASDGTDEGTHLVEHVSASFALGSVTPLTAIDGRLLFAVAGNDPTSRGLFRSDGTASGTYPMSASFSSEIAALDDVAVFSDGTEPWRTDGTNAALLRDLVPEEGGQSSSPNDLEDVGGVLYFMADDGVHGHELWRSDGTAAGTTLVADLTPGSEGTAGVPRKAGDAALFFRRLAPLGYEMWRVDRPQLERVFRDDTQHFSWGTTVGRELYYTTISPDGQTSLWKTDGSANDMVASFGELSVEVLAVGERPVVLAYSASSYTLARTDGTTGGTFPDFGGLAIAGGKVFFTSQGALWQMDAIVGDAERVVTFGDLAGAGSSAEGALLDGGALGDDVFFALSVTAPSGEMIHELWKSDGTERGTARIAVVPKEPPIGAHEQYSPAVSNGVLFFSVTGAHGTRALWRTDGTSDGTSLVRDVPVGGDLGYYYLGLCARPGGGVVFAAGDDAREGTELWMSDGTREGTRLLPQIAPFARSGLPFEFAVSGDRIFFAADDGVHGRELWVLPPTVEQPEGCACSLPGRASPRRAWIALLATAAVAAWRRARRER